MNYYIGDLHFGCTNKYENRTLETDKYIIENWNHVVHQNDDVYLLGMELIRERFTYMVIFITIQMDYYIKKVYRN